MIRKQFWVSKHSNILGSKIIVSFYVFFRLSQNVILHMPYLRSSVGIIQNPSTERIMETYT